MLYSKYFFEAKPISPVKILVSPSVQIPFCKSFKTQPKHPTQNGITTSVKAIFPTSPSRINRLMHNQNLK